MGCGCFSCVECVKFLSGSPGKSGSGSVDDFPDSHHIRCSHISAASRSPDSSDDCFPVLLDILPSI